MTKEQPSLTFYLAATLFLTATLVGCLNTPPLPTPTATLEVGATRVSAKDGMTQVYIPAGEFLMGSTDADIDEVKKECSYCQPDWFKDEAPQHKVYLDAFWIDKTEVTNAMFAKFVAATGYKSYAEEVGSGIAFNQFSKDWRLTKGANWQHPFGPASHINGLENYPVVQMNWNDAQAYCEWVGGRLPTEAEWEKAARGTDGRKYPWGNQPVAGNLLNFADRNIEISGADRTADDGYQFTAPVGSYPEGASLYGVLDMAGNAAERVADWYSDSYYTNTPTNNPTGPSSGEYRVLRGGSWSRVARYVRVASRYKYLQKNRSSGISFRCVRLLTTPISSSPTSTPTPLPPTPYPLSETSMEEFTITDFDVALHTPVDGDANTYLILGNTPVATPTAFLSPELAAFLGRWEGYSYAPPVKKDWKFVLAVQEITAQEGKALLWAGTNLQYPRWVKKIHFRVVTGEDTPSIEWGYLDRYGQYTFTFTYDRSKNLLQGWQKLSSEDKPIGPIELSRDQSFYVYKDYAQYLASKRIYPQKYRSEIFPLFYGQGYLLYLPEGYEDNPKQTWPLIIFLHGSGDRGDNVFLLAKASPFMMIREKGPLPFIIVAPLLSDSENYGSFPDNYLKGVLEEVLADYRVDQKRIYVTGLSMGGEATYRFALLQPNRFAAIAPLAAYLYSSPPMESIKDVPVWAIHGADDTVVPLTLAQRAVDALKQAGGNVRFDVLKGHDHDVWTDTYSDPRFYEWLLQHQRQ